MDYKQYEIKRYSHWEFLLHMSQYPFIGRCYAWALRNEAKGVLAMNALEREELFEKIMPEWHKAVNGLYKPDNVNLVMLCTESKHLNAQMIPRYETPRIFHAVKFIDPDPTGNYALSQQKVNLALQQSIKLPLEIILRIRDDIRVKMNGSRNPSDSPKNGA